MEDGSRPAPGLTLGSNRLQPRARSLVASARARLDEAERRSQEEFKQAIAELEGEMEQEGARQLRAIAEDLDRDLVFLQAVTTERITELAAHALDRLLQPRTRTGGRDHPHGQGPAAGPKRAAAGGSPCGAGCRSAAPGATHAGAGSPPRRGLAAPGPPASQSGSDRWDLDAAIALLGCSDANHAFSPAAASPARWARQARRSRSEAEKLSGRMTALAEERALLQKYQVFFEAVEGLFPADGIREARAYPLILRTGQQQHARQLREHLVNLLGAGFELRERALPGGEIAALLLVPPFIADRVDRLLAESRIQEVPLPRGYTGGLSDAMPHMRQRLAAIALEEQRLRRETRQVAATRCADLATARAALHDTLARFEALPLAGGTRHAFVLEGWLPAGSRQLLASKLEQEVGNTIVIEELARERWAGDDARWC